MRVKNYNVHEIIQQKRYIQKVNKYNTIKKKKKKTLACKGF